MGGGVGLYGRPWVGSLTRGGVAEEEPKVCRDKGWCSREWGPLRVSFVLGGRAAGSQERKAPARGPTPVPTTPCMDGGEAEVDG